MIDLSTYNRISKSEIHSFKFLTWYFISVIIFENGFFPISKLKVYILKLYGAKIGDNCVLKPSLKIKYPWKLQLGNNVWLGEQVWIDNLDFVLIGSNVCVSQGSYLLTGSHNMYSISFDLITKPILIDEGVWICAKSIILPGIHCKSHSVLAAGSVAKSDLDYNGIYLGNPAILIKKRKICNL
jgi:putative colanic acid biosynthesis acetyltransferase WcaF